MMSDAAVDLDARAAELGAVPATLADVPQIFALQERRETRMFGAVLHAVDDLERDMARTPSRHWKIERPDGTIKAFIGCLGVAGAEHVFAWADGDDDVDPAIGPSLVMLAVDAARSIGDGRPVHIASPDADTEMTRWIVEAGGERNRRFGRMEIALDPEGRESVGPDIPAGVEVRNVEDTDSDWRILYDVINTAFLDHFGNLGQTYEEFLEGDRSWVDDYSLCWLATVDGAPAAALLGKQRPGHGYVGVLGTLREFRGRGLGSLLLRVSFTEFARRGETVAALNVDLTNPTGAVGVYESAGMHLAHADTAYQFPPS